MTMDDSFAEDGSITVRCEKCGSNIVPPPDETPDETLIACVGCGANTMAAPNIEANAANMLNMPNSIFLFVEFCSAFQNVRTLTPGDALLQSLVV
jgi:flavoprotein